MGKLECSPYLNRQMPSSWRRSGASRGASARKSVGKTGAAAAGRTPGQVKKELFEGYCESLQSELADIQRKRHVAERVRHSNSSYTRYDEFKK